MRLLLTSLLLSLMAVFAHQAAYSENHCATELFIGYFPEPFVKKTFNKFGIPAKKQTQIMRELAQNNTLIVETVEQTASRMNPNPLRDTSNRETAVLIFRQTILAVFTDVMENHGIKDKQQIQAMLDDIQQQKSQRFTECLEKHAEQLLTEDPKVAKD